MLGMALAACGGSDSAVIEKRAEPTAATATTAEQNGNDLRDAESVLSEREQSRATKAELGDTVRLGDLRIIVKSIDPAAEFNPAEPWQVAFHVSVRSENPTGEDQSNPNIAVYCDGIEKGGSWFASSTWSANDDLPAKSFREGVIELGYPDDENGYPRACGNPVLRAKPTVFDGEPPIAQWAIVDEPTSKPTRP